MPEIDARTVWAPPDADELARLECDLRGMLGDVESQIEERMRAARADWHAVQSIWQRAVADVPPPPPPERQGLLARIVFLTRWVLSPDVVPMIGPRRPGARP